MHIFFSSSFFGHWRKSWPFYVSSGKLWGKTLNFFKNIQDFLLSGHFRYKAGTFSSSLSNVHCACRWSILKGFFSKKANFHISFSVIVNNVRKSIFKGKVVLFNHFCPLSKDFCACWQKFFDSVVKRAFYMSMLTVWGYFFPKKTFFLYQTWIFNKTFPAFCRKSFRSFGKTIFFTLE